MPADEEDAPSGAKILRHKAEERGLIAPAPSTGAEEIERHFATHFGAPQTVFHELVSDLVHIDVHLILPRPERNSWTLFTTGMSDLPMTPPDGVDGARFAELVISLPPDWRVDLLQQTPPPDDLERWYWPIRWIKMLARLPHEYRTWLDHGHTVPNGDPPRPFVAGTKLCCWLLLPPVSVPEAGREIALADGRKIRLLALYALHPEEVTLKLNKGLDALIDAFEVAGVSEVLDVGRPLSVRKKRFGLF